MKICIHTLGCKVNAYESECIEETFVKNGYEVTHNNEESIKTNKICFSIILGTSIFTNITNYNR